MPHNRTLTDMMREDWDARIDHDYLAWMNDRVHSDSDLWETGQRDFLQLVKGLDVNLFKEHHALEIGCGVGRIIRAASPFFGSVTGVDISHAAIAHAKRLNASLTNANFQICQGNALPFISSDSIDFLYSFGTLCNMPVIIFSRYLLEIQRILKFNGRARLQLFLGKCAPTYRQDTAAFRSFDQNSLEYVMHRCGLGVESIEDLEVGAEIPDDGWLRPVIVSAQKSSEAALSPQEMEEILCPGGERSHPCWTNSPTEAFLGKLRVEEFLNRGEVDAAQKTLDFFRQRGTDIDTAALAHLGKVK